MARTRSDDCSAPNQGLHESAPLLGEGFGGEGSPPLAQLIQNRGRWPQATLFGRLPRGGQRSMEGAALLVGEVVAFIICDEVDHRTVRQSRGLVEYETTFLNARSEGAHVPTIWVAANRRNRQAAAHLNNRSGLFGSSLRW